MKPVRFTRHAIDKFELLRQWGFSVDRERIAAELAEPQSSSPGYAGRSIAQLNLDEDHVLRVVYEESGEILIITMYPVRRDRYED